MTVTSLNNYFACMHVFVLKGIKKTFVLDRKLCAKTGTRGIYLF